MVDPVLAQRARAARLAGLGKRVGYLALLVTIVAFGIGVATDLPAWSVTVVAAGFAVATVALVPAIILGYAVRAAEREDRAAGRVPLPSAPAPGQPGPRDRRRSPRPPKERS